MNFEGKEGCRIRSSNLETRAHGQMFSTHSLSCNQNLPRDAREGAQRLSQLSHRHAGDIQEIQTALSFPHRKTVIVRVNVKDSSTVAEREQVAEQG